MGKKKTFVYRDMTGGTNLRSNEANINQSERRTEMFFINNMEIYREGGLASQKGNTQLNTNVSDETEVLGIGEFKYSGNTYAVYQKASGKAYVMDVAGGNETEIKSGLDTSAKAQYVEFNEKVVSFNGVDTPWAYDGSTTPAPDLADTPANWATRMADCADIYRGGRIMAGAGTTLNFSALGNENDWTTASDAGSVTNLFSDNADITAISDYDKAVGIFTGKPKIYLLTGSAPSSYATDPVASNRAALGKFAHAKINDNLWFFSGDAILPLITTELDIIKLGKDTELTYKISPFLSDTESDLPLRALDRSAKEDTILLPHTLKNELIAYFKTNQGEDYDTAAIFNFNTLSWVFRQATPITAARVVGGNVLTGTSDGKILKEFTGNSIVGSSSFTKHIITPYFDFEAPHIRKRITQMYIWFRSNIATSITAQAAIDFSNNYVWQRDIPLVDNTDAAAYSIGAYGEDSYGSTGVVSAQFPINLEAESFQFDFSNSDSQVDFRIIMMAFEVEYDTPY